MQLLVNRSILARGWKRFTLMHRDRTVAAIRGDCCEEHNLSENESIALR